MNNKKILCFDLDNVICITDKYHDYNNSKPNLEVIKFINSLFLKRNYIIKIYTARGMGKFNGNLKKVKTKYEKLTKLQLKRWKLKYHELVMGKISYDLFIDDKAFGFKKNWIKDYKKKLLKLN
jgi:hypothetical protein